MEEPPGEALGNQCRADCLAAGFLRKARLAGCGGRFGGAASCAWAKRVGSGLPISFGVRAAGVCDSKRVFCVAFL